MMTLTYPRSGSNYFNSLSHQELSLTLERSHDISMAEGIVITIARNPKDTLQSHLTMSKEFNVKFEGGSEETGADIAIRQYCEMYDFLYKRADIVIDYEELISFPDEVLESFSNIIEKPRLNYNYKNDNFDDKEKKYLVSSKTSKLYDIDHLSGLSLFSAEKAYKLLLSKKNIII